MDEDESHPEKANSLPPLSAYKDLPILKLNYTSKSEFAFDNTTKKGIEHLIGDIYEKVWGKRAASKTFLDEAF